MEYFSMWVLYLRVRLKTLKVRKELKDQVQNLNIVKMSALDENLGKFFSEARISSISKGRELHFEPEITSRKKYFCEQCTKEISDKEEEKKRDISSNERSADFRR